MVLVNMEAALSQDVQEVLKTISNKTIDHVFYVACGGSQAIMNPVKYHLDRNSKKLRSDVYNSDEFIYRNPLTLSERSLVILCSQTGTTKETVRATAFAKSKGALTVGLTVDRNSPLAKEADFVIKYEASYTTGIPIDAVKSNYSVLYQLNAGLVKIFDGIDKTYSLAKSLSNLQQVIDKAQIHFNDMTDKYAERYQNESVIYSMASGANYGAAYSFAICVLMEMQWINSQAIHSGEFFHGPFEVLDKNMPFILMKGLDETRAMDERAEAFLKRFGDEQKVMILDAKELDFTGVDQEFQTYLTPLIFFEVLWKFAYKLADLRQHPMLTGRRYMKKVDC
jgi:fructoselysine 6-phosphate deglycase